jgi:predicted dinucleotide-binding enzyme
MEAKYEHDVAASMRWRGLVGEIRMRIGFVGAGRIGRALAVRFATAGHDVMLSNSRGPDTLAGLVASVPGSARAGTVAEAARFGQVVAVAIPVPAIGTLAPEPFAGTIVIDANNYYPAPGGLVTNLDADETTSSELLASLLPGVTVVKAFNTLHYRRLLDDARPDVPAEQRLAVPIAGDDVDAKRTVIGLIDQIGFTAVDAGTLAGSRRLQPGSPVYLAYADSRQRRAVLTASQVREILADGGQR